MAGDGGGRRGALSWLFPLPRPASGSTREAGSGFRLLHGMGSLFQVQRFACPQCGKGPLVRREDGAELDVIGGRIPTGHPVMVCASLCGYVRILDREITSPETLVRGVRLFARARSTFFAAAVILVAITGLGFYVRSGITVIGGVFICTFIAMQAAVLRYRGWQLSYRRLFEDRAPVSDWLAWEAAGGAGQVGVPGTEPLPPPPREIGQR